MIRDYLHVLKNLPGILARINSELEGKASTASVDALRYTVGRKADQTYVTKLAEAASDRLSKTVALDDHNVVISIINERLSERPTMADLSQAKIDLGVRIDGLEAEIETLALNAVKTGEPNLTDTLGRVVRIDQHPGLIIEKAPRKPRKPKGPQ